MVFIYGNELSDSDDADILSFDNGCFSTDILINDDNTNEANQTFVIALNLLTQDNLENQLEGYITSSRNVSIGWIIDDDRKFNTYNLITESLS